MVINYVIGYNKNMDVPSDKTAISDNTGPVELIVAFGHRLKLHRINSKDKLNNAFAKNSTEKEKRKNTSRLPRVIKTPLPTNNLEESGDTFAGSSRSTFPSVKSKQPNLRSEAEKLKKSHIPRRRIHSSPAPKDSEKKKPSSNYYANESRRVQRVHVSNITPDFAQDDHIPSTSIGTTRPIPTLGQIYKPNNIIIDGDRFYDWFMELDTPVNSLESNPRNTQDRPAESYDSTNTAPSVINAEVPKTYFGTRESPKAVFGANVFKTTNDNVSDWLTTELDYSTKDNESGYRSMSPTSRATTNIESKYSDNAIAKQVDDNYNPSLEKTSEHVDMEGDAGAADGNSTDMPLAQQPTVVISTLNEETEMDPIHTVDCAQKMDIALEALIINKSERNETHQFPSTTADCKSEKQAVAPSYVDCPSEVLQKTTNFEGDGSESPNTLSSIAGTDLEIRDEYSSLYTLENVDDCNLEENSTWCPGCRSQSCLTFIKSRETEDTYTTTTTTTGNTGTTLQNSSSGCYGDKSRSRTVASVIESEKHIHRDQRHFCHGCGRRTSHGDSEMYCKKQWRYRRFPSYRYKISRPFDSLRKKLSLKRICRHRWNHVWKKTTAKWKSRSAHSKLRNYRMLEYLQKSIIWEDVDVQTMMMLYREAGTHTILTEQKSAGVSALSMHLANSAKKNETDGVGTSARSFKSNFKQINLGPSRFPFFYNSKRKSMPLRKLEGAPSIQRFNSYPEKHKTSFEGTRNTNKVTPFKNSSITCELLPYTIDNRGLNVKMVDCPCETDKTKTDLSNDLPKTLKNIHKLKTSHTGTEYMKPWLSYQTQNTSSDFLADLEMKYNTQCTQVPTKSVVTAMSHAPIHNSLAIGKDSKYIPIYKPYEPNTESEQFEPPHVLQVKTLTDLDQPEQVAVRVDGVRAPLQMMSWRMSKNFVPASTKPESAFKKDEACKVSAADGKTKSDLLTEIQQTNVLVIKPEPASTKSESGQKKAVSMKLLAVGQNIRSHFVKDKDVKNKSELSKETPQPNLVKTGCKNKNDLSTETPQPKLIKTDTNITSISSARMLPVAVFTSANDLTLENLSHQVKVTSSCQCDSAKSLACRCNDSMPAFMASTGLSYQKMHKSTSYTENEDQHINKKRHSQKDLANQSTSTNLIETDTKQTKYLSDQFVKDCESTQDAGTVPSTITKKSTYVFTTVDFKSAFAITSHKNTQSFSMATSNEQDPILKQVSASTNTSQVKETRSIGLSAISFTKPEEKPMIDTWVQYSHVLNQNEKHSFRSVRNGQSKLSSKREINDSTLEDCETEPMLRASHFKSVAVMTSGLLDEASNTGRCDNSRNVKTCTCARVAHDVATNTYPDLILKPQHHTACSTQVFQSFYKQNLDKGTCGIVDYKPSLDSESRNTRKNLVVDQLTSLQVKSNSQIASDSSQPITSTILSSNLNAEKWIKRCTNDEKDYQSIIDTKQSPLKTLKPASASIALSSKSIKSIAKTSVKENTKINPKAVCDYNSVSIAAPSTTASASTVTATTDSRADSLPTNYSAEKTSLSTDSKKITEKITSDEVNSKPNRECILQVCPDLCDTGTDSMTPNIDNMRSAAAFTSRWVFPSPSACCKHNNGSTDCIYIYDRPRCAVHKKGVDVAVQMSDQKQEKDNTDVQSTKIERAIDNHDVDMFPSHDVPLYERKNPENSIEEVLPPKVYKALYETSQMVVNGSSKRPMAVGDTVESDLREDEAALIRALAIRSVAILTSKCGMCASQKCCKCKPNLPKTDAMTTDRAEYVYAYSRPSEGSTQTCSNCHARLLDIPPYYYADIVEDHLKTQFVGSCRYYSKLLTKRLERVKDKVTKHLAPSPEQYLYFTTLPKPSYVEACTMKPSGRRDLSCQTTKIHNPNHQRAHPLARPMSYCALAPSLTNICGGAEKNHLNSVYYMLSAIEGRIRRLKQNVPS